MRLIGYLQSETSATAFSDFLYAQGIKNEIEHDKNDHWALWVHEEEAVGQARSFLASYVAHPGDTRFQGFSRAADDLKRREKQDQAAAQKRLFDRRKLFPNLIKYGVGPLTGLIILFCAGVFLFEWLNPGSELRKYFYITAHRGRRAGLPEILHGEVWRLLTPIFLHGSPSVPGLLGMSLLHIGMNMLWLRDLGSMIEARQGTGRLALLVLVTGVLSNVGQFWTSGPNFGGMSGVIYGLLGYVWIRGKFDRASGLFLPPQTVTLMMIWFFICLAGVVPRVANTAHGVGLIVGIVGGFLSAKFKRT